MRGLAYIQEAFALSLSAARAREREWGRGGSGREGERERGEGGDGRERWHERWREACRWGPVEMCWKVLLKGVGLF
jgi:hypothetical protein